MADMPPIDWRSRTTWHAIGYGLTAVWMLLVLVVSGNNPEHPLFTFIFIVPIAGWLIGISIGRVLGPRLARDDDPPADGPEDPDKS